MCIGGPVLARTACETPTPAKPVTLQTVDADESKRRRSQ
jgi:hypothetical protein